MRRDLRTPSRLVGDWEQPGTSKGITTRDTSKRTRTVFPMSPRTKQERGLGTNFVRRNIQMYLCRNSCENQLILHKKINAATVFHKCVYFLCTLTNLECRIWKAHFVTIQNTSSFSLFRETFFERLGKQ